MTWEEKIKDFESYLKFERNFSKNTLAAYIGDIQKLRAFAETVLQPAATPENISYQNLQEYLYHISKEHFSERTQARWISSMKTFFKFLLEEELREDNPAALLEGPKVGLYLPDTLSPKAIDAISQANDRSTDLGKRNHCIIEVLYGCGLRVSELVNLKISNIFFKEGYIKVDGKGDKTRFVPLADYTAEAVKDYLQNSRNKMDIKPKFEDFLIINNRGTNMSRVMVFLMIKNLADKANIAKKISPHTFRHSFATHLLQNGADIRYIQEMLGHSSITTTEIYTHLETEELREVILKHHPRNIE